MKLPRSEVLKRVERWRRIIVPDWNVVVFDDPPPDTDTDDVAGCCEVTEKLRSMKIWLNLELATDDQDLDETIVHELLHGPLDLVTRPARDLGFLIGDARMAPLREATSLAVEHACEGMARAFVSMDRDVPRDRTYWHAGERGHLTESSGGRTLPRVRSAR